MMNTSTFVTLVLICLTLYFKLVDSGRHCRYNCQCPNGTACLPAENENGRKRCQECGCRLISQCIKPSNEVLCDCSDPLYTGMYCETRQCPAGWFKDRDSCYYYVSTRTDWFSANTECQLLNLNAYLVEITDSQENTVVYTLAGFSDPWIGLTDSMLESNFEWINSGESPVFTPGTIYYSYSDERDCVFMHNTHWDAGFCNNDRTFVCELPLEI